MSASSTDTKPLIQPATTEEEIKGQTPPTPKGTEVPAKTKRQIADEKREAKTAEKTRLDGLKLATVALRQKLVRKLGLEIEIAKDVARIVKQFFTDADGKVDRGTAWTPKDGDTPAVNGSGYVGFFTKELGLSPTSISLYLQVGLGVEVNPEMAAKADKLSTIQRLIVLKNEDEDLYKETLKRMPKGATEKQIRTLEQHVRDEKSPLTPAEKKRAERVAKAESAKSVVKHLKPDFEKKMKRVLAASPSGMDPVDLEAVVEACFNVMAELIDGSGVTRDAFKTLRREYFRDFAPTMKASAHKSPTSK